MATMKDVARLAGVSVSTVSKYINGGNLRVENAEAIRSAIEQLDYRVNPFARSLKTQRSKFIGILIPEMTAPFYGSVVTALDRTLREFGYHSVISCYGASLGLERDNLRFLLSTGIDGLVYAPEDLTAQEFLELTANCGIPYVQIDRVIQGVESDAVLVDNAESVYRAVRRLVRKGHRRIAIITGPKSVYSAKERLMGYLRALSDFGIFYDDNLVINGQMDFFTGYLACGSLLNQPDPPTAIVAANYDITIGLVTAARERGLDIPNDVDIFGFDCVEICSMLQPPLPVVHQPEERIGQIAAEYLVDRLNGYAGEPRQVVLKCSIEPE